jgi:FG-GAP repeat protein
MRKAYLGSIVLLASAALAMPWGLEQRLVGFDARPEGWFGATIAADAETLAVGLQSADPGPDGPGGAVYVYAHKESEWIFETKIANPDYQYRPSFGRTVALKGSLLAIGDPWTAYNAGAVYLYFRVDGHWTQLARVTSPDPQWSRNFGDALALDEGTLAVRATHPVGNGAFVGEVYLFDVTDPTAPQFQGKLVAPALSGAEPFGECLSVSGSSVAASSRLANLAGQWSGAAFVFQRAAGVWGKATRLVPSDPQQWAEFGCPLQLQDARLAVGALGHSGSQPATGAVYVFDRATSGSWTESARLTASDAAAQDWFGSALALQGDRVVVGVWRKDVYGLFSGAAYVFDRLRSGAWRETERLVPPTGFEDQKFGYAAAVAGGTIFIGAPRDVDRGAYRGSVFAFGN